MFSIGDFARIAQVSKRQLRFYDQLGLFKPAEVHENGRRFYRAAQLAELNRVLSLQQLGFSLEQIAELVREQVPLEALKGMLKLKQAESERRLADEGGRYRAIASRLEQIERLEDGRQLDVVTKLVPAQRVLSVGVTASLEEGSAIFRHFIRSFTEEQGVHYGPFFIHLFGNDYDTARLEGEIGRVVMSGAPLSARVGESLELNLTSLAQIEAATYIVEGGAHDVHLGYAAIGAWAEANAYRLAGGSREMLLQLPQKANGEDAVIEVQVPVSKLVG